MLAFVPSPSRASRCSPRAASSSSPAPQPGGVRSVVSISLAPGTLLCPARPKEGIRAARPNELWHLDAARIRLVDGTVKWIHGVIDNHSRKLLAWTVGDSCRAAATEILLRDAVRLLAPGDAPVTVLTDG